MPPSQSIPPLCDTSGFLLGSSKLISGILAVEADRNRGTGILAQVPGLGEARARLLPLQLGDAHAALGPLGT